MTREELRDQMLAPVLKWTRLGRQANEAALAARLAQLEALLTPIPPWDRYREGR